MLFGAKEDTRELTRFASTMGLRLLPFNIDQIGNPDMDDPEARPGCYLSYLPVEELHPYGEPPIKISDASDPLIQFLRPYYSRPYLVAGRIYWSDDAPEFEDLTKPYYNKLQRWVRKNWKKREEDGYYVGPEAERLIRDEGAKPVYFPPGTKQTTIEIP